MGRAASDVNTAPIRADDAHGSGHSMAAGCRHRHLSMVGGHRTETIGQREPSESATLAFPLNSGALSARIISELALKLGQI